MGNLTSTGSSISSNILVVNSKLCMVLASSSFRLFISDLFLDLISDKLISLKAKFSKNSSFSVGFIKIKELRDVCDI